jgi:BirA family biotin operon repressor/biotin-[acetyl-CoA-carboxylase] ligase
MDFPLADAVTERLTVLPEAGSTNDVLRSMAAASDLPDFTVVATLNQTAGRGRLDRVWVAPPGQALAVSVLLRPVLPGGGAVALDRFGWIPLLAGLAMTRAVRGLLGDRGAGEGANPAVVLKWPNDVLIDGAKVSGLLAELLPGGAGVVVGAGLNLSIPREALPVPTATSLTLAGVPDAVGAAGGSLADRALAGYLGELGSLWAGFLAAGADAAAGGIRGAVMEACGTLGRPVRVALPDGTELLGEAVDLDAEGRLRLRTAPDAALLTVAAGDITHLRYE